MVIWIEDIPVGYMLRGRPYLRPTEEVERNIEHTYNGSSGKVKEEFRRYQTWCASRFPVLV